MILSTLLLSLAGTVSGGEFAVWHYGADLPLRDRLIARGRMYEDLGGYLVGEPDAALASWSGLTPVRMALTDEEELLVVVAHAHDPLTPLGLEAAGRALWVSPDARLQLRAAPKAVLTALDEGSFRCHGAGRMVNPAHPLTAARSTAIRGGGRQGALSTDPDIQSWVAQVAQANLLADVQTMENFVTRRHGQPGEVSAQNWLAAEFAALGLSVSLFDYDYGGDDVIAELPGLKDPSKIVVIGGHYDSINHATGGNAPGADDDASGVAAVLEIARILSTQQFDYTIRFCAWSGEELGLLGSKAYATHLDQINADVIGMVQLDMIAYRNPNDTSDVDFVTNSTDPVLTAFAMEAFAAYVPSLPVKSGVLLAGSSDHQAFFSHGFPACFPFEDLNKWSPYIHTANDLVGVSANDFLLAELITEGALATIAELARPVSLTLTHAALPDTQDVIGPYAVDASVIPLGGATTAGVDLLWRVDGGAWNTAAMTPAGPPDSWTGAIPGQIAPARVEYYLLATATNGRQAWLPEGFTPGEHVEPFLVGALTSLYANGFEGATDEGWTHAQIAIADDWQRGAPKGKSYDPLGAAEGANAWGTDIGPFGFNGKYEDGVQEYLSSPVIDCSGRSGVHLRFQRWLTVEDGLHDQARIEVNGSVVWENPAGQHLVDTAWTGVDLDLSAWADNNPAVQVTFRLQSDASLEFSGWNVDQFELYVLGTSGAGTNTIALSGPASVAAGGQGSYSFGGAPANASFWLLNGSNSSGTVAHGHSFDVGGSIMVLASGQANGAGAGSVTLSIPAGAAGGTGRLEIAAVAGGVWADSNLLVISVQ